MVPSVYDLREFYKTRRGRIVRRVLVERIRDLWPDVHGLRVMGAGYAVPYLRGLLEEAERGFSVMYDGGGVHEWPLNEANLVCLSEEGGLPFETNSVDRIVVMHGVEFSDRAAAALEEIWRVLKSNGRMLVVVPHRGGFWSRADKTPFGHGTPYSGRQIKGLLRQCLFVHERSCGALYLPPFLSGVRGMRWFERFGQRFLPFGAGVHIVEVSKQLYAEARPGGGSRVGVGSVVPRPVIEGINLFL